MIHGAGISLRPLSPVDIDEVYDLMSAIEEYGDYYPITFKALPTFKKKYEETGLWEEDYGSLLLVDKEDNFLGEISFFKSNYYQTSIELGGAIFKEVDRGKGYMTEAINLFVPYLFAIKQVNRIEAAAMEGNLGSQRVLEKCGFTHEGIARQALFYRGDYVNLEQYSILRDEAGPLSFA